MHLHGRHAAGLRNGKMRRALPPITPARRPVADILAAPLAQGADWIAIDKPAGLATHPGPRTPDSVETRLAAAGGKARPAHRLDRDTSGVLLLGRNRPGLVRLSRALAAGEVEKAYLAILPCRNLPAEAGVVSAPLEKQSSRDAGWRMVVSPRGQPAETQWRLLARRGDHVLVLLKPRTGRTHQLRVHVGLIAPGAAIRGDPVYGGGEPGGLMLHAWQIGFPDGAGGRAHIVAPLPQRFRDLGVSEDDLPVPEVDARD
jgi:tRNA pseudouridine32 synthase/23S rRNA pseudouridine746 synthase